MIKYLFIVSLILNQGCVSKINLLQKKSDTLSKSSCETCTKEPFYINGHFVK